MAHDEDDLGHRIAIDPTRELEEVLDDLESLAKNPDVVASLTSKGVNASLTLVAIQGIRAYLLGDKSQAADDLRTVSEEIEERLKFGNNPPSA